MEDFPSNSHNEKSKTPPMTPPKRATEAKKVEQITKGEVVRRKKPLGTRLRETFVGGDARSVWSYVMMDVLVPAAKDMIADAGTQAIERSIFGEARSRGRGGFRSSFGSNSYNPYNRYATTRPSSPPWSSDRQESRREVSRRSRETHDFGEIILESRGEAEEVIDQLIEIVSQYQQASVADLYAMVGITPAYTDGKYGWTDLRGAGVSHVRGGAYLLNLPKPEPLD